LVERLGLIQVAGILHQGTQTQQTEAVARIKFQTTLVGGAGAARLAQTLAGPTQVVMSHDVHRLGLDHQLELPPGQVGLAQLRIADAQRVAGQDVAGIGQERKLELLQGGVEVALGEEAITRDVQGHGVEQGHARRGQEQSVLQGLARALQGVGLGEVEEGVAEQPNGKVKTMLRRRQGAELLGLGQHLGSRITRQKVHQPAQTEAPSGGARGLLANVVARADQGGGSRLGHETVLGQGRHLGHGGVQTFRRAAAPVHTVLDAFLQPIFRAVLGWTVAAGHNDPAEHHGEGLGPAAHATKEGQKIAVAVQAGEHVALSHARSASVVHRLGGEEAVALLDERQPVARLRSPGRVARVQHLGKGDILLHLGKHDLAFIQCG